MAKNPITVLQEGKAAIDELNAKLIATNNNILKISESAREAGKSGLFNAKIPNEVNASLQQNKGFIEQVNVAKKEQERLEKALIVQIERSRMATESTNRALAVHRFETQEQNKAIKEAAILSSKLASEYQKLQVRYNQTAAIIQSLNAKRLQGQKLSAQEQAQLKKSTADFQRYQKAILGADASIGRFNRNVGNYPKALNAAASAARNFAGAMGLVGGAFLVVRVISDAFKRLREFDKEMQNMAGILRTTRPELKELEDRIIKVASVSIKTTNEVAKLATSLLTLGKTKDEVMLLLEPVNNLSIGLETTSEEAGEFLIQTLNAFGKGADSADEFADTIAGIRTSTSLDFQKMWDSFAYISPISKILNKDLAQTGALIGVLADNGIKAESAGRLLATAQLKLATEGKTLEQALEAINKAYRDGKRDIELAAVASQYFDSQSVKLGITLAQQQDRLKEYEDRIRSSAGALDDLVNEQLKSVDAQLKITTSTWETFILSIENGEGAISEALAGALGFINETLKGFTLLNKSADEYNNTLKDDIAYKTLKEASRTYKEMGDGAEKLAQKEADRSADRIEAISKEIDALKLQNETIKEGETIIGSAAGKFVNTASMGLLSGEAPQIGINNKKIEELNQSLGYYNGLLEASENVLLDVNEGLLENTGLQEDNQETKDKSIATLRELIKLEKERIETLNLEDKSQVALIPGIQKTIEGYQKEIDAILGNNKARSTVIEAVKGSIAWLKKNVSALEEEQSKLATNSREWTTYKSKIDEAKQAVKDFEVALKGVNDGMSQSGGFDSAASNLLKELEKKPNPLEGFNYDKATEQLNNFAKNHKDKQQRIFEIEKEFTERRKELQKELASASIDVVNNLFDAKVQRYEDEINRNNDHYAALLDTEELSLEQRSEIEAERDRKNLALEKKKREEEKKAAIFNKAIAVGQIAIKTAETIAAINLAAAQLNAISFGVAGTAFAAVQIPMAIALGAAQTAAVLAVPIPQYAEGKGEYDKYEGTAIWGEKKREVKISKDGSIEISPRKIGNHLTHVKKDDVIHPDADKFLSSLTDEQLYNDIHKYSILASLSSQNDSLRLKQSIDSQTDRLIKGMKQNKPKVVIYNNNTNTLSDDISFMLRKQNTL